ncbi:hypothetical protein PV387_23120 [Streptomyces sp. ME02-6987-2C]|uniref:hypothetical protein n=1 Tax=unclassified Streptomyces TaxID=2593676 RepID=UPI0029B4D0E2|nr:MULTISPECIES: hypothetical protein [unclassified Streptomyces]MDX3345982.1 hypothetical protein [Streptomyces sp. ME02-6979A]MDX3368894.1 hypothetical protein [Streptomyces sp. ME02-6987-2C]MDX3407791.1 hypothetical protein [Streptomyces sp. ME02-6977A]MDX3421748.1 hypothetical protein [Streptomyces sp. ME02-6985-2c]
MNPQLWESIARALKTAGGPVSNEAVSQRLGCARRSVAKVRADLGLQPYIVERRGGWTLADYEALTVPLRGGHRRWRGRHSSDGVPMAGRALTAYRLAFRLHHDRPPVGWVIGTCSLKRCVAGAHLEDDVLRAARAAQVPAELPTEATWRGMDIVAIRRCLRGPEPWPALSLVEARFAFRFSDPGMSAADLGRRLGVRPETIQRYRTKGAPC